MAIFKLIKDECFKLWWRSHYEIEANTLEEAVKIVNHSEIDPYDIEILPDLIQTPIDIEIYNEEGNLLFKK